MIKFEKLYSLNISFFLIFFAFLYYFIASFGYGNDSDIFRLIQSGKYILEENTYCPSRFQGNIFPEFLIGVLSVYGGHYLSNAFSVLLSIGVLLLFYLLLKDIFSKKESILILLILAFNPYFILISTSSMDYIYSFFFVFLGVYLLKSEHYWWAAIFLALSISSRLAALPLVISAYLYFLYEKENFHLLNSFNVKCLYGILKTRLFLSGVFAALLSIVLYIPVYIVSGYSFDFLAHAEFEWSYLNHFLRFIYKNVLLLGWISTTLILISLVFYKKLYKVDRIRKNHSIWLYVIIYIALSELLFLKVPTEVEFLVPLLFVIIPLFVYFSKTSALPYLLLLFTLSQSFLFNIELYKSTQCENPEENYNKTISLNLTKGVVIDDISEYSYKCSEFCPSDCQDRDVSELLLKRQHSYLYYKDENLIFKDDSSKECK